MVQNRIRLSLVITAKDKNDPKLAELLRSIEAQDFPKDEMETLVITEGTSESAKAIGIRKAVGEVIGILASDNFLPFESFLTLTMDNFPVIDVAFPARYHYMKSDDILNRYFALIGGNDVLSYYMKKNDRLSYLESLDGHKDYTIYPHPRGCMKTTIGDNGFFIKRNLIAATDLDNYYHIDNAWEAVGDRPTFNFLKFGIWHKTGGSIIKFFRKRYRYGLQHAFNSNRRWHLVDFRKPKDIWRLAWFVLAALTVIQPLSLSVRGWLKIRDKAWFLHPLVCLMTLGVYTILVVQIGLRRVYQSLSAPWIARTA